MIKGLIISLLVFIATTVLSVFIAFIGFKGRKKWKLESKKWENSYNNLLKLQEKNAEVIKKYEDKKNNIEPSVSSYNSIVSDWNQSNKVKKDTRKTKSN